MSNQPKMKENINKKLLSPQTTIQISSNLFLSKNDVLSVLELTKSLNGSFGLTTVADVLKGSRSKKMLEYRLNQEPQYESLSHYKTQEIREILNYFIHTQVIHQDKGKKFPKIQLTKKGEKMLAVCHYMTTPREQLEKEKKEYLALSSKAFFLSLTQSSILSEWKTEYVERQMKEQGALFYKQMVECVIQDKKMIPYLKPYIREYYEERYFPIFSLYQKTKKGEFGALISQLLKEKAEKKAVLPEC